MKERPFHRRVALRLARMFHPILEIPYRGRRLTVDSRDLWVGGELFYSGTWQERLTNIVLRLGLEGKNAIDVGANVGVFTVNLSDAVGADGRVVAIEPSPHAFAILQTNISRLPPNVTPILAAAGSSEGSVSLHTPPGDLGGSHFADHGPCSFCVTVKARTVDAILADLSVETVALMKIDVQGAETAVLEGARETLLRSPDAILIIEVECDATRALVARLWRDGWRGWEVTRTTVMPWGNERPRYDACDLVIAHSAESQARVDAAVADITRGDAERALLP